MTAEFSRLATRCAPALAPATGAPALRRPSSGPDELRYLAFVDGLRAVSILAVVGYHIGVPGLSGGFVGVDVFFVISGFLIINQIKAGLVGGKFSIVSFYAHRALRILPPFLIVLLATYAVAPFVLPTTNVDWDFLPSAILSPLMLSNVAFLQSQGYFDIAAIEKPLLHTWTLAVEEQFYLAAPILLVLVFRLGQRRFGALAAGIGLALAAVSLAGAIAKTATSGQNPAFYMSYWRAWEFLAGGFIGGPLVAAFARLPRAVAEVLAGIGLAAIVLAITTFDARMPYPSWNAVLPVAGAALVILGGIAQPATTVRRLLARPWFVGIGLVSYGWYLWHWPILSFIRIARLDESSLLIDGLGGGLLGFLLACASYRYLEQPIRRWRRTPGNLRNPRRIVLQFAAACVVVAAVGGASSLGAYSSTKSFLASHYGVEGKGVLDNGCRQVSVSGLPDHCFEGQVSALLGDSHALALFDTLAKRLDAQGVQLVSFARGGCDPLLLAPSQRTPDRRDDCARLIAPFERLLARPVPPSSAIITAYWLYQSWISNQLTKLISQFDRRTRVLLIGQVPTFHKPGLECVVLSDRYDGNRDRCVRPRGEIEAANSAMAGVLKSMPQKFPNLRYIDPMDVFCDRTTCRPFSNDTVLYSDEHHLLPSGVDRLYDAFERDFLWLAGKE